MVSRYDELIATMPQGRFYATVGRILPFRDTPYEFLFEGGSPNTVYGLFVNNVEHGEVTTDLNGDALVSVLLERGRNDMRLENDDTGQVSLLGFVDIRDWATWHAAYADVFEDLDEDIAEIHVASKLSQATPRFIEDAQGKILRQPNDMGIYVQESYRQLLRQMRQAYRLWGSRQAGLDQVVNAITSVSPLVVPQPWRPHWILGTQLADNADLQQHARSLANALTNNNQRSRDFVRQSFTSAQANVLRQANSAKAFRIEFGVGWPATADVTLTGVRPDGTIDTEVFDAAASSNVNGTTVFRYLIGIDVVNPSGAATATVKTTDTVDTLAVFTSNQPRPLAQPPQAQCITATFSASWPIGNNIIITGLRPGGAVVSETLIGSSSTTVTSFESFERIYTIIQTTPSGAGTATVGVKDDRFARVVELSSYNGSSGILFYESTRQTLSWNLGTAVPIPSSGRYILSGPRTGAFWYGLATTPATYAFGNNTRLYMEADGRGILRIVLTAAPTPSQLVTTINNAFSADTRYGAAYGIIASVFSGSGFTQSVIRLASPTSETIVHSGQPASITAGPTQTLTDTQANFPLSVVDQFVTIKNSAPNNNGTFRITAQLSSTQIQYTNTIGVGVGPREGSAYCITSQSSIKIYPGGFAPTQAIFGLPFFTSTLFGAHSAGTTTVILNIGTAGQIPGPGAKLRIGRSVRAASGAGAVAILINPTLAQFTAGATTPRQADIGGYINIFSGGVAANFGVHRIVGISGSNFIIKHETSASGGQFSVAPAHNWELESGGEIVTVQNKLSSLVTIDSPLVNAFDSGALVEILGEVPYEAHGHAGLASITVDVDRVFLPPSNANDFGPVVGTEVPDGWQAFGSTAVMVARGYYEARRLQLVSTGVGNIQLQRVVPEALDYKGFKLHVTFWMQQSIASGHSFNARVSFDDSTFTSGSIVTVPPTVSSGGFGTLNPTRVDAIVEIPYNATTCIIQLNHFSGSTTNNTIYIDRCAVTITTDATVQSANNAALFLGSGTVPRNDHRTYFGKVLYVWSPNELNDRERASLGVPPQGGGSAPATPGHIDWVLNAHGLWERFDVSEYSAGLPVNVKGAYTDTDWIAATKTHLDVTVSTPARLSYVAPSQVSAIPGEVLAPSGGGVANLLQPSDMYGTFPQAPDGRARLYKNDIPVPDTGSPLPWQWTGQSQITIDASYFTIGATYTFDYNTLMRAETAPIDLGANWQDYVWLLDAAMYRRTATTVVDSPQTVQVSFQGNLQATLAIRSDEERSASLLIQDNGSEAITVPASAWRYVDSKTVQIDATQFDPNSLYTLSYNGQVGSFLRPASVLIEARSAATLGVLSLASYTPMIPGQLVNRANQFHQLRISVRGVTDVRDIMIAGLSLKGIHLYGVAPSAPGILLP